MSGFVKACEELQRHQRLLEETEGKTGREEESEDTDDDSEEEEEGDGEEEGDTREVSSTSVMSSKQVHDNILIFFLHLVGMRGCENVYVFVHVVLHESP